MQKHIEPIIDMIDELIEVLKMKNAKMGELMLNKKDPAPGIQEKYSQRLTRNQQQITYLVHLKDELQKTQSERSMLDLLDKVGSIEVRATMTNKSLKKIFKRKKPEISLRVPLTSYGKIAQFIKNIQEQREAILQVLRNEKSNKVRVFIGMPDNKSGQVSSSSINQFIKDATTSNLEPLDKKQPPALNDFRRDDRVNGARLPEECTKTADALRDTLMDFLGQSKSIVDDSSRKALCNAMLKNGQTLQTVFTNEMAPGRTCLVSQQNDPLTYSQGVATFNWHINGEGKLSVDLTLDVKSVTDLSRSPEPLVQDKKTGELRTFNPKTRHNPQGETYEECPTLLSYKATINFETKEIKESENEAQDKEVMAVPTVSRYELKVLSNQLHYTPSLTNYVHSEESAAPSVDFNRNSQISG